MQTGRTPASSKAHLPTTILLVIVVCLVLGLLSEGIVRARQYVKYGSFLGIERTYTLDDASGLRIPVPNGQFGGIKIDSRGFRNPELVVPKPASTIRVAFLGASTTYGAEVSSNEATWPHVLIERLRKRWSGPMFDYVNAGVPGYSVESSLLNLDRRVKSLAPDVIIIYHAVNDLSYNSYELAVEAGLASERTEEKLSVLSRYSLLWYLVEKNLRVLSQQVDAQGQYEEKLSFDTDRLAAPFARDLRRLTSASKDAAQLVALVTFSTRLREGQDTEEQSDAALTNLYYMPYMSIESLLRAYTAYNQAIREVAESEGVLLVDGENIVPGDTRHFVDSVHFTDEGSAVMAGRLYDALVRSEAFRRLLDSKYQQGTSR